MPIPPSNLLETSLISSGSAVSLCVIKNHLRLTHCEDDGWLIEALAGATLVAEKATNRSLREARRWAEFSLPCSTQITLPFGPVATVEAVRLMQSDDQCQVIEGWRKNGDSLCFDGCQPFCFNDCTRLCVTYSTGPEGQAALGRLAIQQMVTWLYENRGDVDPIVDQDHMATFWRSGAAALLTGLDHRTAIV